MDADHRVPLGLGHVEEHTVTQDPGDVDEDVEASPGRDGLLHHGRRLAEVRHGAVVGQRHAAGLDDLLDDLVGRTSLDAVAGETGAQVVHDDFRARASQPDRDAAADAAPRPRHQRRLAVEHSHVVGTSPGCEWPHSGSGR